MRIRSAVALLAVCVLSACSGVSNLFKAYEYEEEMYLALDGTATIYVNSSVAALNARIDQGGDFPIVFDAMALTGDEVTALKQKIRAACPAVDTMEFRKLPSAHRVCSR